eukprot:SAG11_NODE_865_length_6832_cov_21.731026_4_plen_80_part_00
MFYSWRIILVKSTAVLLRTYHKTLLIVLTVPRYTHTKKFYSCATAVLNLVVNLKTCKKYGAITKLYHGTRVFNNFHNES